MLYSASLVFVGGGLGALCRYLISVAMKAYEVESIYATLAVNALGALLIGCLLGFEWRASLPSELRLLLIVGFCGGFTTFSTFSAELYSMLQAYRYVVACAYILGTNALCLLLLFLGVRILNISN